MITGQDLHNRVDAVAVEVGLLQEDQKKLSARVPNTESELKDLRQVLVGLEEKISNKQRTDLELAASANETPSDTLPEVTEQTADMLL
ncbi:hypothetical protein NDU88_005160 [Pleurodeles waltl]|uniref:Uncharacterized protein n=1 Tax=Pleurodeles waltl TaxID=8319 RepID=A0AAV7NQN2_PLEWA|nr:hypothetical protein NDU88_005160 [Pleurodeles waltl]